MTYVVVLYFPIFPGKYQYSPLKLMKFQLHVKTFKNLLIPMASQLNLSIPQWILRTTMYLKWAPWITSFYWCILIFFKCNRDKFNFYNKILRKPIFLNIYQMNLNQLTLVYPKIKILKFSDNDTQLSHNDTLVNPNNTKRNSKSIIFINYSVLLSIIEIQLIVLVSMPFILV